MNAQNYAEWCELAGLYLRNLSHFDRYQTYASRISAAGRNVVIVVEFLADNDPQVDLANWRTYSVYEMGAEKRQRVAWTAAALDAIGATRVAAAVRSSKSQSPFEALQDLGPKNLKQFQEAMKDFQLPDLMSHLQQSVARLFPDSAAKAGLPDTPAAPASQSASDHESREEIQRWLEQYVAAHQDDLRADIERYGDPRTVPGFTREARMIELEQQHQRQLSRQRQLEDVEKLKESVDAIQKSLDKARKSEKRGEVKVDSLRRKLLEVVKENKRRPADELLPEMSTMLVEVDAFRAAHPEIFARGPIADDRLNARLAALGEHESDTGDGETSITWDKPEGFDCSWTTFSLSFHFPKGHARALESLLRSVDRLKVRLPQLIEDWRGQIVEHFRCYEGQMFEDDFEDYQRNAAGEVTEASILEHAGGGTITLEALDESGEEIHSRTFFAVDWDEEHGLEIEWEDEPGEPSPASEAASPAAGVRFVDAHVAVDSEDLAAFELHFGIELPDDYRQFLLEHNGGLPQPNHLVLKSQGAKLPADVGRFFSITAGGSARESGESLETATEDARSRSLPASLLPIATIRFVGQQALAMPTTLVLALAGKRKGQVLAVNVEQLAVPAMTGMSEAMKARVGEQMVDMGSVVAKSLAELLGKLIERPRLDVPPWLRCIRENDVAGFLAWLDGGGQLNAQHTDYGLFIPWSVVDYLARDASPSLLEELLSRHALKPKNVCEGWQRACRDVARFRELMGVLPKTLWHRVLVSPQAWSHPELWEQLAAAGVDFNAPVNDEGAPPLHLAVQCGNKKAVKWLIAHGADVHKPDHYERTAFIWAEHGPGFECLPILEGKDENLAPAGEASPDAPGIGQLWQAAQELPAGVGLVISIQIKSPPVTRVEKVYYTECHYLLWIDVPGDKVTFKDMTTPRQDYLFAAEWPTFLFAPILQWPELKPLWETLEVRQFDWQKAMKKRTYQGPLRKDLLEAARSALEQAFQPAEAAARGIRLHK